MAATRVYKLARELGVKSGAIVEKCQDEGLDVKNHMSTISAGLAATIREWFSDGEHATAVETAAKVNLERVRVKKKRKKAAKETVEEQEVHAEEAQAVAAEVEPQAEKAAEGKPSVGISAKPKRKKAKKKKAVEKEPEPVKPAGPMLDKPAPAKLSGPQVVRVEEPEPLRRPPRARRKPRYDEPVTEPLMYVEEKDESQLAGTEKLKPARAPGEGQDEKGRKDRTHGRRRDEGNAGPERGHRFGTLRRERDMEERRARLNAAGGEGMRLRPLRKIATKRKGGAEALARPSEATVSAPIIVKDLSAALAVKASNIIAKLLGQGVMATANQAISPDVAELVALEFGTELTVEHRASIEEQIREEFEHREGKQLKKRPVVATMLGHVDHGKTSLLDRIRSTKVTESEAGGITQHTGAYQVSAGDSKVTFLDTPGHEAFTAMRARGANITDVVVLVVAADDGVMPQTIEAIHHAKAAGVPVIVALNKIDLPGCDINRVYAQLSEHDLTPVEWGGQTEVVKTSAVTGQGIDDLLEHLDYVAELIDLKADDTIPATGFVVEARLSQTRGPVATFLIKEGCLKKGDVVLAGCSHGKLKTLKDGYGKSVKEATSSMPAEVTGLQAVPRAGDRFYCLDDINRAKTAAEENQTRQREGSLSQRTQVTLDNLFSQIEAGSVKEVNVIIRADVQGSVDVLTDYLAGLSTDEVKVKILHAAPGGITEGDVVLAEASNAIVIGFNVVADERVSRIAETKGVEIRLYNIIYRITEDLQKSMEGLLEPEEQEKVLGRAVVRTTFKISRIGTVAGCYVSDGLAKKNAKVRLIRDNIVIRDNISIESLKHFKDDAGEVKSGFECGIKLAKFDDVKMDDVFEFYTIVKVARAL